MAAPGKDHSAFLDRGIRADRTYFTGEALKSLDHLHTKDLGAAAAEYHIARAQVMAQLANAAALEAFSARDRGRPLAAPMPVPPHNHPHGPTNEGVRYGDCPRCQYLDTYGAIRAGG